MIEYIKLGLGVSLGKLLAAEVAGDVIIVVVLLVSIVAIIYQAFRKK